MRVFASDKEVYPVNDGNYEAFIGERIKFIVSREKITINFMYTQIIRDSITIFIILVHKYIGTIKYTVSNAIHNSSKYKRSTKSFK